MNFKLIKKLDSGVRIGELVTPHGVLQTPFFMPVGTVGSVKSMAPWELDDLGAQIVLANTYHLYLRPGEKLIKELGGLHAFMRWDKPILTDSGGYQVFSLGKEKTISNSKFLISNENNNSTIQKFDNNQISSRLQTPDPKPKSSLVKITDDGVEFKSHLDGSKHFFTPEKVIDIQLDLGVDILMPLDVCPSGKASKEEVRKATDLTVRWAERAKKHFDRMLAVSGQQVATNSQRSAESSSPQTANGQPHSANRSPQTANSRPLLHGIVQGGLYPDLRTECAQRLMDLDFDGYSVGGLAVDFETRAMWETVKLMGEILPEDKQRYLMGVGTPNDIIQATKLGMDMFDCVLPTRLARHASVYIEEDGKYILLNLLNAKFREDKDPLDPNCGCLACKGGFSRAYISHLLRVGEILGIRLATLHNLYQYLTLTKKIRAGQI